MQDVGRMLVYADFQTKNHHWISKGCGIPAARIDSPEKKKVQYKNAVQHQERWIARVHLVPLDAPQYAYVWAGESPKGGTIGGLLAPRALASPNVLIATAAAANRSPGRIVCEYCRWMYATRLRWASREASVLRAA